MEPSWLSLLPPLIVLIIAFTTHRILPSLFCGILSATYIATDFSIINSITLSLQRIWANTELETLISWKPFWENSNLFICMFLCAVGIIITLVAHSGGAYAYNKLMKKKLHTKKNVESATLALSSLLFIDDYFNSLTVGSVMHPLTDQFKIPRAKLAMLVDSMAAPLCILSPISSWVAIILMQLKKSGISDIVNATTLINAKPFFVYLHLIPYTFYSIILIASMWFIVRKKISFGLMQKHEMEAEKSGNLFGGKKPLRHTMPKPNNLNKKNNSIIDFVLPILLLFFAVAGSIFYSGDLFLFGGENGLIESLQSAHVPRALFFGGMSTLILSTLFFILRKKIQLNKFLEICFYGIKLMAPPIIILILAWTIGGLLSKDLKTGEYLAGTLINAIDIRFLPVMFFITGAITSFATGSSWGSMAILFPIAVPMLVSFLHLKTPALLSEATGLFSILGAILAGAVSGDHLSPVSETTVMAATSAGSHIMDHVKTQLSYGIPVLFSTTVAFFISGFLISWNFASNLLVSLATGITVCFISLKIVDLIYKKQR